MRTNIELDEKLVREAMQLMQIKTKKDLVHLAIEQLIKKKKKQQLAELWGSDVWEGDLTKMRESNYGKFAI